VSAEDRRLLQWIADAGPAGRSAVDKPPGTNDPETDRRARLMAAGLIWESRRRDTPSGSGQGRHVIAGLGLIALGNQEGQA